MILRIPDFDDVPQAVNNAGYGLGRFRCVAAGIG